MIRVAHTGDAAAIAETIRAAFAAIDPPLVPPPSALRETAESVRAQLEAGGGAVWDEAGIQACVLWRPKPASLYLCRLAVHPAWRGRGVARALLDAVDRHAQARGIGRVTLEVRLALAGNRRLFARAGFRETALRTHEGFATPTYAEAEKAL